MRNILQEGAQNLDPDGDDPYENVPISGLPGWWRQAIREFRDHDLSPYRPPRFQDDVLVPPVVERLETKSGTDIKLLEMNPCQSDSWSVLVDDKILFEMRGERKECGYTVYDLASNKFEERICRYVTDG